MGYFLDSSAPSMSINIEIKKLTVGYSRYMVIGSLEVSAVGGMNQSPTKSGS